MVYKVNYLDNTPDFVSPRSSSGNISGLPRHNTGTECGLELIFTSLVIAFSLRKVCIRAKKNDAKVEKENVFFSVSPVGHVPATFLRVCKCCHFVPATYMSPLHFPATCRLSVCVCVCVCVCTTHVFVAATCCNMSLQHDPSCLARS